MRLLFICSSPQPTLLTPTCFLHYRHMPYDESNVQQMLQNQNERILTYPHQVEGLISKQAKRLIG